MDITFTGVTKGAIDRWRQLDCALAKALHGILKQINESLTEDVVLKTRGYAQTNANFERSPNCVDDARLL